MRIILSFALLLVIICALNWGLVGAFEFNLVSTIFGSMSFISRIIYVLVGLSAIYAFTLFEFHNDEIK